MITKVLLIGCGDVALRLAAQLPAEKFECTGLRRHVEALPPAMSGIAWDLNQAEGLSQRIAHFDVVVTTLVPNQRDEAGYRQAYVDNTRRIVRALEATAPPKLLLFVSSSSVYGQEEGQWVDEDSATEPGNYRGAAVLAGEKIIRESALPHCILRFSGIYGPGRERLLAQVRQGQSAASDNNYSNRIHSEDCAGVLAHLIQAKLAGKSLHSTYLASDCAPTPLAEVKNWLAERCGSQHRFTMQNKPGGKRCSNQRLLESGYRFRYPSFKERYAELLRGAGNFEGCE